VCAGEGQLVLREKKGFAGYGESLPGGVDKGICAREGVENGLFAGRYGGIRKIAWEGGDERSASYELRGDVGEEHC
jgi:hypothetical protein